MTKSLGESHMQPTPIANSSRVLTSTAILELLGSTQTINLLAVRIKGCSTALKDATRHYCKPAPRLKRKCFFSYAQVFEGWAQPAMVLSTTRRRGSAPTEQIGSAANTRGWLTWIAALLSRFYDSAFVNDLAVARGRSNLGLRLNQPVCSLFYLQSITIIPIIITTAIHAAHMT
jgi:hypothetical protein